jgi:hypothetical protein
MKGVDHYMRQGIDETEKGYYKGIDETEKGYYSVNNVVKDYHTYESSPTHQWLKNAGNDNKYANDIHEYTVYKPADHWMNSKPGLKIGFNIFHAFEGTQAGNAQFKVGRVAKGSADEGGEVAKSSADATGDIVGNDAVGASTSVVKAGENPLETAKTLRANNEATDEQALRDVESPKNFANIVEESPGTDAAAVGTDAGEAAVEAMRSRITIY